MPVSALAEQMQIEIADLRAEAIGVMPGGRTAVVIGPAQPVAMRDGVCRTLPLEQVCAADAPHGGRRFGDLDFTRSGDQCPDGRGLGTFVAAQYGKRVVMTGFDNATKVVVERYVYVFFDGRH